MWKVGFIRRSNYIQIPPLPPLAPLLPHRLPPGDSANFLFDKQSFEKNAENLRDAVASQPLRRLVGDRVAAGVHISSGQQFLAHPDDFVMKWLRRETGSESLSAFPDGMRG